MTAVGALSLLPLGPVAGFLALGRWRGWGGVWLGWRGVWHVAGQQVMSGQLREGGESLEATRWVSAFD